MSFDEDPRDEKPSYPCPECGGSVHRELGVWSCDDCDWFPSRKPSDEHDEAAQERKDEMNREEFTGKNKV
jgi:ribosomal protein L37AE/L43A